MAHLCVNKWDAERSHSEDDANESRSEILTPCALVVLSEIYDRVRGERDAFFAPTLRTATPFVITTYSFERFSSPIVLSPTYGATVLRWVLACELPKELVLSFSFLRTQENRVCPFLWAYTSQCYSRYILCMPFQTNLGQGLDCDLKLWSGILLLIVM